MVDLTKTTDWRTMRRCEHGVRVGQRCCCCNLGRVELRRPQDDDWILASRPLVTAPLIAWGVWV